MTRAETRDDAAERACLTRVAAGDRTALATLYRAYQRPLGRFLARLTSRPDILQEVANDCFWIVWQKAADFRGDSRVSTWIFGIAYRCALKALRQHGEEDFDNAIDDVTAVADPGDDRELRDWLGKGLVRLSTEQRAVLELAYIEGYSIEEIAAIQQCPVGTVKARMFHARVKLRHLLPVLAGRQSLPQEGGSR